MVSLISSAACWETADGRARCLMSLGSEDFLTLVVMPFDTRCCCVGTAAGGEAEEILTNFFFVFGLGGAWEAAGRIISEPTPEGSSAYCSGYTETSTLFIAGVSSAYLSAN